MTDAITIMEISRDLLDAQLPRIDRVTARLTSALKYLTMARTSRELDYGAVPYVLAAEHLILLALEKQRGPQD